MFKRNKKITNHFHIFGCQTKKQMDIKMSKKKLNVLETHVCLSCLQFFWCNFLITLISFRISILKQLMILAVISGLFSVSLIRPVSQSIGKTSSISATIISGESRSKAGTLISSKIGFCKHSLAVGLKNGLYSSISWTNWTILGEHALNYFYKILPNCVGLSDLTFS